MGNKLTLQKLLWGARNETGDLLTANGHTYTYGDANWKDLLTAFDGESITYDASGNPLSYYNGTRYTFTWKNGRNLATASSAGGSLSFEYDSDGLRTKKTVNGEGTHYYFYAGGQLLRETYEDIILDFSYDANGYPYALKYNGTTYYYITNLQGDVMYMVDGTGATVAAYEYDPYGNIISATGPMAEINPLRYRGYYYDAELEMYYLQSRYYDPMVGRFINADDVALLGADKTVLGYDLFSYCRNNAVNCADSNGYKAIDVTAKLTKEMYANALYLYSLAKLYKWGGTIGRIALLNKFCALVKTGGKWDLKSQKAWKLKSGDWYVFMGVRLTAADIGNIHFGFVGSVIFSERTLYTGAGIYQIYSGTSSWRFWYSFFDDPRDTACIKIGHELWRVLFNKRALCW